MNTYELLFSIICVAYILGSIYVYTEYQSKMSEGARHHFVSHFYMVLFLFLAIKMYIHFDTIIPLFFSVLYILQHIIKENIRLVKGSEWSPNIEGEV